MIDLATNNKINRDPKNLLQRIYGFEQESDLSRRLEGYFNQ
jgi:hypothetical protein